MCVKAQLPHVNCAGRRAGGVGRRGGDRRVRRVRLVRARARPQHCAARRQHSDQQREDALPLAAAECVREALQRAEGRLAHAAARAQLTRGQLPARHSAHACVRAVSRAKLQE